jgi:tetratricopeptide (TPR) repeat protein
MRKSTIEAVVLIALLLFFIPQNVYAQSSDSTIDSFISEMIAAPRTQWEGLLTARKDLLNDAFFNRIVNLAIEQLDKDRFEGALLHMQLADEAGYIRHDKKKYVAVGQFELGNYLLRNGQSDKALKVAEGILADGRDEFRGRLLAGKAHVERKDPQKAVMELKEAVLLDPQSEDAHFYLGYAYVLLNMGKEALAEFEEVLKINPENSMAKDAVAYLSGKSKVKYSENEKAMEHFNKAEELFSRGKYREAVPEYEKALEYDPTFAKALVYLGDCYSALGDSEKAIECYEGAIKLDPKDRQARRFLGVTCEKLYDKTSDVKWLDKAIESFEAAVSIDPSYAMAVEDLARAKKKKAQRGQ